MNIGERVTVQRGGEIIDSQITYTDRKKSCGFVVVAPIKEAKGHILSYAKGWFFNWWIVGLDNGNIIKVRA